MYIKCFQLSISDSSHTTLIFFLSLKHLKMIFARSKHFERHVLCYMRMVPDYTDFLFVYLFICSLLSLFLVYLALFPICKKLLQHLHSYIILWSKISYFYILLSQGTKVPLVTCNSERNLGRTSNAVGRVLWEELLVEVILHITPLCSLLHTLLKDKCMCLQD